MEVEAPYFVPCLPIFFLSSSNLPIFASQQVRLVESWERSNFFSFSIFSLGSKLLRSSEEEDW